jgi:hypothetical protein
MENAAGAPVIIGATGGSGTRAVQRIVQKAGYYMGAEETLAKSRDALSFQGLNKGIPDFLRGWLEGAPEGGDELHRAYEERLEVHLARLAERNQPWGWKMPWSMLLLPFLHAFHGDLRFIHVVRDGRDMVLSRNKNQLRAVGDVVLSPSDFSGPPELAAAKFWARTNLLAADYGEAELSSNYLRVRYEDLCSNPIETTSAIFSFLGSDQSVHVAAAEVRPSAGRGRWRSLDADLQAQLDAAIGPALDRFGYKREPLSRIAQLLRPVSRPALDSISRIRARRSRRSNQNPQLP